MAADIGSTRTTGQNAATGDVRRQQAMADDGPTKGGTSANGPIVLLSYPHSGARQVQDLLAAGTKLACTSGTGILPLCAAAAETWRRVEGNDGRAISRLAAASVRSLITAQVTVILAGAGQKRWCELATADPSTAQRFLQVFPHAAFVSVHRGCLDVIRDWVAASPWGLHGQGLAPYLLSHPGNTVAALAAYWADATQELLTFEDAHSQSTRRVRYEDAADNGGEVLGALRAWLDVAATGDIAASQLYGASKPDSQASSGTEVPVEMIPPPLQRHISRLNARLGYPVLPG